MEQEGRRRGDRGQAVEVVGQEEREETGGETGWVSPLPVFLFPTELLFYSAQRNLHRRVLTLYNPNRFRISFKMLCTAPSLYRVVEAEGSVRASSCVDLYVSHQTVIQIKTDVVDQRGNRTVNRRPVITLSAFQGGAEEEEDRRTRTGRGGRLNKDVSQWVVCVMIAVLCVTVLMLPLHTESSSVVPRCLHVSTNQKLACAYTLGTTHTPIQTVSLMMSSCQCSLVFNKNFI
uniref:MSP domain-containing protein n=1 Tax=Scophthalmus maximus TaxID=52904 RepID=A0A8D3BQ32_SCOMX